jgi:hypothetical protein
VFAHLEDTAAQNAHFLASVSDPVHIVNLNGDPQEQYDKTIPRDVGVARHLLPGAKRHNHVSRPTVLHTCHHVHASTEAVRPCGEGWSLSIEDQ